MVLPEERNYMATTTTRPKKTTLHNFNLPDLKWGTHRNLRCIKLDSISDNHQHRSSPSGERYDRKRRLERSSEKEEEGIEEFRLKIISDLKTMTESLLRKQNLTESESPKKKREVSVSLPQPQPPGVTSEVKPWNLRKRRAAACKAPIIETETETEETTKLASTLTKKEIEDDYMTMTGHRPPRRPKKRARTVQRQVDVLYPAYYISEITQDIYKVADDVTENVVKR